MEIHRAHTISFSGHRSFKIGAESPDILRVKLREAIITLCLEGYDTFLCGMAEGFDLMAAGEVLKLRGEGQFPSIRLIAVIPYAGQARSLGRDAAEEYARVLGQANHTEILFRQYDPQCFHRRNDFLLDNSSRLVCYYNGSPGGTRYTYNAALKRGLQPINLYAGAAVERTLF